jgi:hypothetical protein
MEEVNGSKSDAVEVGEEQIPVGPVAWIAVPQPLPTDWRVGTSTHEDGTKNVTLEITTPGGKTIVFLDSGAARQLGAALIEYGTKASGLVVP